MNKAFILLSACISLISNSLSAEKNDTSTKKVLINQMVDHPALNSTVKGIIDSLEKSGYKRGKNLELRIESAQANFSLASQIAAKFANQNPDITVGVGTVPAQSLYKYAIDGKIKLVFSSVTDPMSANLAKSLEKPGNNTSGVSNFVDLEPQLSLFKKLQPKLKKLGILYNPGESNSVSIVKKLETLCPKYAIELVKQTVSKTADVAQASVKLASSTDAIFISNDNTSLSSIQSVVKAAQAAKIPVYVSDTDAVELGAVAALGPNQYEVGLQTGSMIARSLNGEDISSMPVEFPKKTDLYINLEAAEKAGITITKELRDSAAKIIEKVKS